MGIPSFFGLQKTSLVDYPGKVAPVIFFPGCNLRCPYCHNPDLVFGRTEGLISSEEIFRFLKFRAPLLGGVVLSGGEPLLYPGLQDFIEKIKDLTDLSIKVDTNGLNPEKMKNIQADYIAMDVKTFPENYTILGGKPDDPDKIRQSIDYLKKTRKSGEYEFRTTLLPSLLPLDQVGAVADLIGDSLHYITGFKPGNCLSEEYNSYSPVLKETLKQYQSEFKKYGCRTEIR